MYQLRSRGFKHFNDAGADFVQDTPGSLNVVQEALEFLAGFLEKEGWDVERLDDPPAVIARALPPLPAAGACFYSWIEEVSE